MRVRALTQQAEQALDQDRVHDATECAARRDRRNRRRALLQEPLRPDRRRGRVDARRGEAEQQTREEELVVLLADWRQLSAVSAPTGEANDAAEAAYDAGTDQPLRAVDVKVAPRDDREGKLDEDEDGAEPGYVRHGVIGKLVLVPVVLQLSVGVDWG